MKKLLALLLTLTLCCASAAPYAAAAETGRVCRLSEQLNTDSMDALLNVLGAEVDGATLTAWTKLVNTAEIVLHTGNDYVALSLMLSGEEVAQAALFLQDDVVYLTSSLLSDAAISIALEGLSDALSSGELFLAIASQRLLSLSMNELAAWEASLSVETERGLFEGETFANGRTRSTYRADDRDVALLVSNLALAVESDADFASLVQDLLGESWSLRLREALRQIALSNVYTYELAQIYDKYGKLNGLTLQILREGQMNTQISAGFADGLLSEVLLADFSDAVTYFHCDLTRNALRNQLTCVMDMRQTDSDASYSTLVSDGTGEICLTTATLQADTQGDTSAKSAAWEVSVPTQNGNVTSYGEATLTCDEGTFTFTLADRMGTKSSEPWSLLTCTGGADASFQLPELDSLTILREDDPDMMNKLDPYVNQGVSELMLNLFRTVPAELMVWLIQ